MLLSRLALTSTAGSNMVGGQYERGRMPADPGTTNRLSTGARWSIVVISLFVTASSFLFINGIVFLIPALQARRGDRAASLLRRVYRYTAILV